MVEGKIKEGGINKTADNAKEIAERLASERKFKQLVLFDEQPLQTKLLAVLKGEDKYGRDEFGNKQKTKSPGAFNVKIVEGSLGNKARYPKMILLKMKRDNSQLIHSLGLKEIENDMKKGKDSPKKTITIATDIFRAVRLCKHLREGYQKEINEKNKFLEEAEFFNAELSELQRRGGIKVDELKIFLEKIDGESGFIKKTAGWKTAEKLLAKDYLEGASDFLKKAIETDNGSERSRFVAAACAKMTAFRNRLGEWRDKKIGKFSAWNFLRECSLRKVRDDYLKTLFDDFLRIIRNEKLRFAAVTNWNTDMRYYNMLLKAEQAIDEGKSYGEVRALLVELYKISRYSRIKDDVVRIGKLLKDDFSTAKTAMEKLELLLTVSNPFYVFDELEKTNDAYLSDFLGKFKLAVDRLQHNDVWRAATFLEAARTELDRLND